LAWGKNFIKALESFGQFFVFFSKIKQKTQATKQLVANSTL